MPLKYKENISKLQNVKTAIGLILIIQAFAFVTILTPGSIEPKVLQDATDSLTLTAQVPNCEQEIVIHPEKRIPASGNWDTDLVIEIYDSDGDLYDTVTGGSNALGEINKDYCSLGSSNFPGEYDYYIKGLSHLRRAFLGEDSFLAYAYSLDLSTGNRVLYAGETSQVDDNFINGLDLSTQIRRLYTGNNRNDLNQDGEVNVLDLSNTITNLYRSGD